MTEYSVELIGNQIILLHWENEIERWTHDYGAYFLSSNELNRLISEYGIRLISPLEPIYSENPDQYYKSKFKCERIPKCIQ